MVIALAVPIVVLAFIVACLTVKLASVETRLLQRINDCEPRQGLKYPLAYDFQAATKGELRELRKMIISLAEQHGIKWQDETTVPAGWLPFGRETQMKQPDKDMGPHRFG